VKQNHSMRAKLAAGVLVLAMGIGAAPALAADTINTTNSTTSSTTSSSAIIPVRTTFTDVLANNWYTKHISKLAALGIIEGPGNGLFAPDTQVSQQDVILMAIRMMGLEGELKGGEVVLPQALAMTAYAKPYAELALSKGLLKLNEETETSSTPQKTSWGERPATREWVAKIVIRAIGQEPQAVLKASLPSTFKDSNEFSNWAVGYVNQAYLLGIVNGIDDSNFGPKGSVTRAQMATFLSRADKYLTTRSSRYASGYVMDITDKKISIQDARGVSATYNISPDAVVYGKDDKTIPLSSIKLTNEVYVVQSQGSAYYLELTDDQERMESFEGTLSAVYLDNRSLAMIQAGKQSLWSLADNVAVTDKDGRGLSLSALQLGSKVELKRSLLVKDAKIVQIIVKEVPVSKKAEGTIVSVDKTEGKFTFLEQTTGQQETFSYDNQPVVFNADGSAGDFSKLKTGDVVGYEIAAGNLKTITIRKAADFGSTVKGKLSVINADKTVLTINPTPTTLGAYYIADNAIVSIEGLPNAGLFDLEPGDDLSLDLVNEKVVKINVTNRSVNSIVFAKITLYEQNSKVLIVDKGDDVPSAFKVTDTTVFIDDDGDTLKYDDFVRDFVPGKRVDIKASKEKLTSIRLTETIEGTISQINTATDPDQITIRTGANQNITLNVRNSAYIDIPGKTGAFITDLKVGDYINAQLRDQELISQITINKTAVYKVQVKNSNEQQISVRDENGVLSVHTIVNSGIIVKPGQTSSSFEDIAVDEYVKLSFTGNILEKVTLLGSVRGKVNSIDTATGSVTVQDYSGAVQVVPVGKQFVIKMNGVTSAALTSIKPNDRVEIIKDDNGKVVVNVAAAAKRTVASYDYVLNQLLLKPTANGDKTTYNFYAKAYLHKGTTAVAPSSFVENEELMVYIIDDKIVEIEK
jgi:hypothetical protein